MARSTAAIGAAKRAAFLEAFAELGTISHAAKAANVSPDAVRHWRERESAFAEAFHQAELVAIDNLEREARRRAIEGVEEPVYQGGKKVGGIRKYSDTLLIFLMKGANPSKYRERVDVNMDIRSAIERLSPDPAERDAALAEVRTILAESRR